MNNKISNTKTEVPEQREMNDKDYITAMLEIEKAIVKNLSVSLTEASNSDLYNDFYDMFDAVSNMQRQIYELMFKKGWYCLEIAEQNKISEKLNKLTKEIKQIEQNN